MKTFLKMLLASMLGGLILFFIVFIIFASLLSISKPEMEMSDNTILEIDINAGLVERAEKNPFQEILGNKEITLGLNHLLAGLRAAREDDHIIGVYLKGGIPMGSNASVKEFRDALLEFRESGKFVTGYANALSVKGLYLTSAADSFYVNPQGMLDWTGLSSSVAYYREGLDKLGVKPVVLRATGNKFKSAVEPFLGNEMTDENRQQLTELLGGLWGVITEEVSDSRGLSVEELNTLADSFALVEPFRAAELGLISGTRYEDEMRDALTAKAGVGSYDKIAFQTIPKYAKGKSIQGGNDFDADQIAVIIAQGDIIDGEGSEYSIGSRIAKAIRDAREKASVKAIVLRINSPGGSALASELIWREVDLARQEKPVIASMGGLAASGGYYIACVADTIVAQPNTITGSIGAFGLFFTAEELLNEKMGINIETVKTNRYADLGTVDRDLTPSEHRLLIKQIDRTYGTFVNRVAEGRDMSESYVDSIGQGRVYSGLAAKNLGLVDVIGGLPEAITIAAEKAGLEEYRTAEYPRLKDPLQEMIEKLTKGYQTRILHEKLGPLARHAERLQDLENMKGTQMRMEYELVID